MRISAATRCKRIGPVSRPAVRRLLLCLRRRPWAAPLACAALGAALARLGFLPVQPTSCFSSMSTSKVTMNGSFV